jgi:hypothetical protein
MEIAGGWSYSRALKENGEMGRPLLYKGEENLWMPEKPQLKTWQLRARPLSCFVGQVKR